MNQVVHYYYAQYGATPDIRALAEERYGADLAEFARDENISCGFSSDGKPNLPQMPNKSGCIAREGIPEPFELDERRRRVLSMYQARIAQKVIAATLGVPVDTVNNDVAKMRERGLLVMPKKARR